MYEVISMLKTSNSLIVYFDFTFILLVIIMKNKKLRVVLQERKVASLNNLIYIEPFSLSISVFLGLSRFILIYLDLSWFISVYFGSARFILIYFDLSARFILIYFNLSISGYQVISCYFGQKWDISGYLRVSWAISGYLELP